MAKSFESLVVSDLCLGKPALKPFPLSSSVGDALLALNSSGDSILSLWTSNDGDSTCVGKITILDIFCFLSPNYRSPPVSALQTPVSLILPKSSGLVKHVQPSTSLIEACRLILEGFENLVVPIQTAAATNGVQEYCWLTDEDIYSLTTSLRF